MAYFRIKINHSHSRMWLASSVNMEILEDLPELEKHKDKTLPREETGLQLQEVKCVYCDKENHATAECMALGKKPHEEKFAICKSKGLCFACLQSSYLAKDRKQRMTCKIRQ